MRQRLSVSLAAIEGHVDAYAKLISQRAGSINPTERAKLYGMVQLARAIGVNCSCMKTKRDSLECACRIAGRTGSGLSQLSGPFSFDGAHCRDSDGKFVPVAQCTGRRPKRK